jgi:hypothetical protein
MEAILCCNEFKKILTLNRLVVIPSVETDFRPPLIQPGGVGGMS